MTAGARREITHFRSCNLCEAMCGLEIRAVDGGRPVRFETGSTPEWTLPDDAEALEHGATYAWTVAPVRGRPTREQRFTVIGAEAAHQRVVARRRQYSIEMNIGEPNGVRSGK